MGILSGEYTWTCCFPTYHLNVQFYQAIELYSRANHIKPGDSIILSNRCAAYLRYVVLNHDFSWRMIRFFFSCFSSESFPRISQFLRNRPPSASEHRPLNGLDPTTHAGVCSHILVFLPIILIHIFLRCPTNFTFEMYFSLHWMMQKRWWICKVILQPPTF